MAPVPSPKVSVAPVPSPEVSVARCVGSGPRLTGSDPVEKCRPEFDLKDLKCIFFYLQCVWIKKLPNILLLKNYTKVQVRSGLVNLSGSGFFLQ